MAVPRAVLLAAGLVDEKDAQWAESKGFWKAEKWAGLLVACWAETTGDAKAVLRVALWGNWADCWVARKGLYSDKRLANPKAEWMAAKLDFELAGGLADGWAVWSAARLDSAQAVCLVGLKAVWRAVMWGDVSGCLRAATRVRWSEYTAAVPLVSLKAG